MTDHILEPAAQQLADATSKPPFLYEQHDRGGGDPGLNPVRDTAAATAAVEHAIHILRKALHA
jgi:hypothetical protein